MALFLVLHIRNSWIYLAVNFHGNYCHTKLLCKSCAVCATSSQWPNIVIDCNIIIRHRKSFSVCVLRCRDQIGWDKISYSENFVNIAIVNEKMCIVSFYVYLCEEIMKSPNNAEFLHESLVIPMHVTHYQQDKSLLATGLFCIWLKITKRLTMDF